MHTQSININRRNQNHPSTFKPSNRGNSLGQLLSVPQVVVCAAFRTIYILKMLAMATPYKHRIHVPRQTLVLLFSS